MNDPIFTSFLEKQLTDATALAERSDLVDVCPVGPKPHRFLLEYRCKGIVKMGQKIVEADRFQIGIHFSLDYLRRVDPSGLITLLSPTNVFHPNVLCPFVCAGRLHPGTSLVDIIYQVFEIITYAKVTMNEFDALNPAACAWARKNVDRFPIDTRPLLRRRFRIDVERQTTGAGTKR